MKTRISEIVYINQESIKANFNDEVYYLDTSSVTENIFEEYTKYANIHDAPSRARRIAHMEDTIISTVRPNKKHIGFIAEQPQNAVYSTGFAILTPIREKVDPYYLYLLLSSKRITELLQSIGETSTSTYPSVKPSDIGEIYVELPDLAEQQEVTKRLRLIDKKIHINNKINANLAELKTTLFIKIFGNKMTSSLNGKLSDLAKIKSGKRPTIKQEKSDALFPYPIIGASKVMGYTNDYLYNEPVITTGRVGTHGVIQYFKDPVWISDNSFAIITKYENYIFELLSHRINYSALNTGSTQPLITQKNLRNVDIYVPESSELNNFESKVSSMTNLQFNLKKESDKLNEIRQLLLNDEFKLLN